MVTFSTATVKITTATALMLCAFVFNLNPAIAVPPKPVVKQQSTVATISKGTHFEVKIDSDFESVTAKVGDKITAILPQPLATPYGATVLPAGTRLIGSIKQVESAGKFSKSGSLTAHFDTALLPNHKKTTLSAFIATGDGSGKLTPLETGSRFIKTGGQILKGAGIGAALGGLAGLAKNSSNSNTKEVVKTAAIGGGAGAGVGLLSAFFEQGDDIGLSKGKVVKLVLDAPLSFKH